MANPLLNFFGFKIKTEEGAEVPASVVAPTSTDGSIVVNQNMGLGVLGDSYNLAFDPDGQIKDETDLIKRYRELSRYPEVSEALENIINEAIVIDSDEDTVTVNLDDVKISPAIKKKIIEEFRVILNKMNFNEDGYELFEKWYVDGKIYINIILDAKHENGIKELRFIDPRKIKKIKNVKRERLSSGVEIIKEIEEYYIYNDAGVQNSTTVGVRLSKDSIVYCHSGLVDASNGLIQSHLHKAIKPANQLKMLEEAVIIYRYTRAPERRVFYIDVGNLPKGKAEQYVNDMMNKFKNKLSYDAVTGDLVDSKRHLSMMEDFWMPRRGDKSTEITTLPGGQGLGNLDDLDYFKDKLYRSLNVPKSRFNPDTGFSIGKSDSISRDEIKFSKFITKLRNKFSNVFLDILRVQLISKQIFSSADWDLYKDQIGITFAKDNYFSELKENEILSTRLQTASQLDAFAGKYISKNYIQKNVLKMTDEEIAEQKELMTEEKKEETLDAAEGADDQPTENEEGQ